MEDLKECLLTLFHAIYKKKLTYKLFRSVAWLVRTTFWRMQMKLKKINKIPKERLISTWPKLNFLSAYTLSEKREVFQRSKVLILIYAATPQKTASGQNYYQNQNLHSDSGPNADTDVCDNRTDLSLLSRFWLRIKNFLFKTVFFK